MGGTTGPEGRSDEHSPGHPSQRSGPLAAPGERRRRIFQALAASPGDVTAIRLCEVCRDVTGMTGAGIMLMSGDLPVGSVGATGTVSAYLEDLQFTLGEGPCVDAFRLDRPVFEPDLADPVLPRWLAFTGPAVGAGVRAIFGFPLGVGAARLGALNLFADRPMRLTDDQHADALVLADVSAEAVLAMQARETGGMLAAALEHGSNLQYVVHQAAGMVSAQLDVSVAQALVRLRGYAFGHQRLLSEVAADIVARRLHLAEWDA